MTTIKVEMIELARLASEKLNIPNIRQVYIPEPHPAPDKDSEFGIIVLEDDAAGLYYAWMGEEQTGMNERYAIEDFIGLKPVELVQFYESEHEADRSLGLAAINAISQSVFRQLSCPLPQAGNSMGELDIKAGDHIGMVGYFPSLVRRLKEQQVRVTVVEKNPNLIHKDDFVNVTGDSSSLMSCNKILSTASTLLNDTLDEILTFCQSAEVIVVVGPTAGFLPDPLFKRGVSAIGGSEIVDVNLAIARLSSEQGLGDAARKYILRPEDYAVAARLLAEI